jgi:hypothetical protein
MCLYHNVNMNHDKAKAGTESSDFLLEYYREDPSGILDKCLRNKKELRGQDRRISICRGQHVLYQVCPLESN